MQRVKQRDENLLKTCLGTALSEVNNHNRLVSALRLGILKNIHMCKLASDSIHCSELQETRADFMHALRHWMQAWQQWTGKVSCMGHIVRILQTNYGDVNKQAFGVARRFRARSGWAQK